MIVNEWEPYFTENYGHQFPDTYLCIDTEYTGGNEREDLITEIGHVMVQNNVVVDRMNIVLNWFSYKEISVSLCAVTRTDGSVVHIRGFKYQLLVICGTSVRYDGTSTSETVRSIAYKQPTVGIHPHLLTAIN